MSEKLISFEGLHFLQEAVKSHHYAERAKLLTDIYCERVAKKEFEKEFPGEKHVWDLGIQDCENKLKELNERDAEAREFLKSLDRW